VIDREILLILVGGAIGALSSMATLVLSYILEGMRLRRLWQREDQLQLRKDRADLQSFLTRPENSQPENITRTGKKEEGGF